MEGGTAPYSSVLVAYSIALSSLCTLRPSADSSPTLVHPQNQIYGRNIEKYNEWVIAVRKARHPAMAKQDNIGVFCSGAVLVASSYVDSSDDDDGCDPTSGERFSEIFGYGPRHSLESSDDEGESDEGEGDEGEGEDDGEDEATVNELFEQDVLRSLWETS